MLTLKRLVKLMEGSGKWYVSSFALMVVDVAIAMIAPMVIKTTIDSVLGTDEVSSGIMARLVDLAGGRDYLTGHLWVITLTLLAVALVACFFAFFRGRFMWIASETMAKNLKDRLYNHLQKLPYDYHIKAQSGDLIQRCTSDVDTVRRFVHGSIREIGRTMLMVIFSLSVMASVNVKLMLLSSMTLPLLFASALIFFTKVKSAFLKSDEKEGELSAVLQESLAGIRVVRAFGRQKYEYDKFEAKNVELRDLSRKVIHLLSIYFGGSDLFCIGQVGATLLFGVYFSLNGEPGVTVGTIVMFGTYVGMLVWPVRQMGRFLSDMGKMQVSIGRLYEILDTKEEEDAEGSTEPNLRGDIVFDDVTFEYEAGKPVLKGLSFNVKQGETIAVLGATGAGKSTLFHLLLRLYDYKDGSVKINGNELRNIKKRYLRGRIGIVLQEPFLFSRTVRENIKMAKHTATDEEIENAAKTASIHGDVTAFEKGYETMVGEKGVTLSGGQKQRVAIARTLIKDSDVLIFDDSLSAVDTETDAQIRAALKEREHDATTFIISQRITTLMQADRIFVIEDGKLTAAGTHAELAAKDGLYRRIWAIQSMLSDDFDEEQKQEQE